MTERNDYDDERPSEKRARESADARRAADRRAQTVENVRRGAMVLTRTLESVAGDHSAVARALKAWHEADDIPDAHRREKVHEFSDIINADQHLLRDALEDVGEFAWLRALPRPKAVSACALAAGFVMGRVGLTPALTRLAYFLPPRTVETAPAEVAPRG